MIPELYEDKLKELELTAVKTRELIISTLLEAGSDIPQDLLEWLIFLPLSTFIFLTMMRKIRTGKTGIA